MNKRPTILAKVAAFAVCLWLAFWMLAINPTWANPAQQRSSPADLSKLRDITGIEKGPLPPSGLSWLGWLVLGLVLLAAGILAGWRLWRRFRSAPSSAPADWAVAQLDDLEAQNLPASGQIEKYHTLLSDILRRYVELRFSLHAPQQSTEEFLEALRPAPQPSEEHKALLRDFLERCDLAKFARAGFSSAECQEVARMARAFVEQTRPAKTG